MASDTPEQSGSPWRDEETLRSLYVGEGKSISQVADELDTSYSTVYRWMERHNIPKRQATQDTNGPWRDKETLEELYIEQRLTIPEVAEELECGKTTIHRWLKNHGIGRRNSGGRRERAWFGTDNWGYERWNEKISESCVRVHRLQAVAEYGFDAVKDKVVHHRNGFKWDNRPDNLELMTATEHSKHHYIERERADSGGFKA